MAKNLNWFEARALARVNGRNIRRDAWRKWLQYDRSAFLWFLYQPAGVVVVVDGADTTLPESRHVVLNAEFRDLEFLANDWTDEDWNQPPASTPAETPPDPCPPGYHYDAILRRCVIDLPGDNSSGGGTNGGTGGDAEPPDDGDQSNTEPPDNGGGGDNGGGTGSDSGGGGIWFGGGGGGPGGGGGGGKKPPKPPAVEKDYTPTVELNLDGDPVDGPSCYIHVPDEGHAFVNVTIPNPVGGTVPVLMVSVTCLGQTKMQTMGPGTTSGFEFKGPINPGGEVVATATASDGNGHIWTGHDKKKWKPRCLLPTLTWSGTMDTTHRCNHGSGPVDGFDVHDTYSVTAQYAVNPDAGAGKVGNLVSPPEFVHHRLVTTTPYPGGTPTTVETNIAPPNPIHCDVSSAGAISNVTPASLNLYPPSGTTTTGTPPNDCTETKTASESGPNGPE